MTNEVVPYAERWAAEAQQQQQLEGAKSAPILSTKGGMFRLGDQPLGNELVTIIVDSIKENTFYADAFDENNQQSPTCYAYGYTAEEMGPHPDMQKDLSWFQPQANACIGCPQNEWGSAGVGKAGKACSNRRRLALLPAGQIIPPKVRGAAPEIQLFEDIHHFEQSDATFLKLAPSSVKNYEKYVNTLATTVQRPTYGVYTSIRIEPDPKYQFVVNYEMLDLVPDALFETIMTRRELVSPLIVSTYPAPIRAPSGQVQTSSGLRR